MSNFLTHKTFVIEIVGLGCEKCIDLEENIRMALDSLDVEAPVYHRAQLQDVQRYDANNLPVLVIDGKAKAQGSVLSVEEIIHLLKEDF